MGTAENDTRLMSAIMGVVQILCFIGFFNSKYGTFNAAAYEMYLGVALMMLVGFGYLMTFLKQYGLGAVGFTFIITSLAVQINVLLAAYIPDNNTPVIDPSTLMDGNFAAAAVLISYGCIIGKASPSQLVVMTIIESVVFQVMPPSATTALLPTAFMMHGRRVLAANLLLRPLPAGEPKHDLRQGVQR